MSRASGVAWTGVNPWIAELGPPFGHSGGHEISCGADASCGAGVHRASLLLGGPEVPGSSLIGVTDDHLRTNVETCDGRVGAGVLCLRLLSVVVRSRMPLAGSSLSCDSASDVRDPKSGAG
jgi:hypothetical protein